MKRCIIIIFVLLLVFSAAVYFSINKYKLVLSKSSFNTFANFLENPPTRIHLASFSKNIKEEVKNTAKVISINPKDKKNYELGLAAASQNNWDEAIGDWDKIATSSFYYQKIIKKEYIPHLKPDGELVQLVNYRLAHDPSWAELVDFLNKDDTDDHPYEDDSFVCTNFAETLHNRAERAGIRAAYVGISFPVEPGHALNAFQATDKGLVYVDDTGVGYEKQREDFLNQEGQSCEQDKVGYVLKDKEYGSISIDYQKLNPTDYQFYQSYVEMWGVARAAMEQLSGEVGDYNNQTREYAESGDDFEKDKGIYEQAVADYNSKVVASQKKIEAKYEEQNSALQAEFSAWSVDKAEYESELAAYNSKVELYKSEAKKDVQELKAEYDTLEAKRQELNSRLEALNAKSKALSEQMQAEVDSQSGQFNEEKKQLEQSYAVLEEKQKELAGKYDGLKSLGDELNEKSAAQKDKEEELGVCFWKPLGAVKDFRVYW